MSDEDVFRLRQRPKGFSAERDCVLAQIRELLPNADVHEVGSTAILDLPGKQDIDILVRVESSMFSAARDRLDRLFPRNSNQLSSSIYQGYQVPSDLDVAIQLTVRDGPHDTFLAFLDALRRDSELVKRYAALKRSMDGQSMSVYREAKARFIRAALACASTTDNGEDPTYHKFDSQNDMDPSI